MRKEYKWYDISALGIHKEEFQFVSEVKVDGHLSLDSFSFEYFQSNDFELPVGLELSGNLDLRWAKINKLPIGVMVSGSIFLSFSTVSELSDTLTVPGDLDISYTNIRKLPDNLTVLGHLVLYGLGITRSVLPSNIVVEGQIMGLV